MNEWETWLDELITIDTTSTKALCFCNTCVKDWKESFLDGMSAEEAHEYWTEE